MHYARYEKRGSFDLPPKLTAKEMLLANRKINPATGCWLWTKSKSTSGYGQFYYPNRYGPVGVHRVAFIEFRGHVPDGLHVLHKCDVRHCFNPNHLFTGTDFDNMQDAAQKGRIPFGGNHSFAVLDDKSVKRIRKEYASGQISQSKLAKRYGCTQGAIFCAIHRKTWKHVA